MVAVASAPVAVPTIHKTAEKSAVLHFVASGAHNILVRAVNGREPRDTGRVLHPTLSAGPHAHQDRPACRRSEQLKNLVHEDE